MIGATRRCHTTSKPPPRRPLRAGRRPGSVTKTASTDRAITEGEAGASRSPSGPRASWRLRSVGARGRSTRDSRRLRQEEHRGGPPRLHMRSTVVAAPSAARGGELAARVGRARRSTGVSSSPSLLSLCLLGWCRCAS
uniref:Uncharacterized protein n=1 Tax=Triticum urartu TaxID=4572 RepID=A0A8R7PCD9_TRIUA